MKWGERVRAGWLMDLAQASGWIHMDQRSSRLWMETMKRRARGEARPKLPAGVDLSKFSERVQRAYRMYYGVA